MGSDINAPLDTVDIKEQLFAKMIQKRDEFGQYAVEMLETADRLLMQTEQHSRQAEAAAYCIRQSVVEIFGDEKDNRKKFSGAVKLVIKARRNIRPENLQDGRHIQNLLSAVDDLKYFEIESKYKARITQIFQREAGTDLASGGRSLPSIYQRLIDDLNAKFVHPVSATRGDLDAVRECYTRAIDILTMIFLPSVWLQEIASLARLRKPQAAHARRLKEMMINPIGFDHFANKMVSSDWFDLMDPNMLKPDSDDQPWPLRSIVNQLKDEHTDKFSQFVEKNFELWAAEDTGLAELGFAAKRLGDSGLPLLVKALQKSESVRHRCDKELDAYSKPKPSDSRRNKARLVLGSIRKLENHAIGAYCAAKPTNPALVKLADHLMNPGTSLDKHYKTNIIPIRLVEGIDSSSAMERIKVLIYKIQAQLGITNQPYIERLESVADIDQNSHFGMNAMIGSLCSALASARDSGLATAQLVGVLSSLPDGVKHRFVAWLYSGASDVDRSVMVDFVVESCGSRYPTGDDEMLLTRLKHDGRLGDNTGTRMASLMCDAPDLKKMVGRPRNWDLNKEEVRSILWAHMLHRMIKLPDGWGSCVEIMNPLVDEERGIAGARRSDTTLTQKSPIGPEISGDDPRAAAAKIATWDTEASGLPGYVIISDIVSKLGSAVKSNTFEWAENPIKIINILRHPAYVACYFDILACSIEELHAQAGQLISAVRFARTHPWDAAALGSLMFDYAGSWDDADAAGIGLIKAVAYNNVPLDDEPLHEAWNILCEAVANRTEESSEDTAETLTNAADRKLHTRALNAMMYLIHYAAGRKKAIPEKALTALTESVMLTGRDGKEHRAVLGAWIKLLRMGLPDWFKRHESLLLGNKVSEDLGQTTFDMHLLWGMPDEFVLENYRDKVLDAVKRGVPEEGQPHKGRHPRYPVLDAVKRGVPEAMKRTIYGMLEGIAGYDPKFVAKSLVEIEPLYVSNAGRESARLLRNGARAEQVQRGVDFWSNVLDLRPDPEALAGYGWWAIVPDISQSQWENLTLRTCNLAGKKLDRVDRVAERISSSQEVTDVGLQILVWLMRADLGFGVYPVAEHALEALRKSKSTLGAQETWTHLYEIMLWHDPNQAAEL